MVSKTNAEDLVCYGQYGQIIPCPVVNKSFNVEKTVIDGQYLIEEIRGVKANQQVAFSIKVKNTGELRVSSLRVIDNLPANLEFISLTKNGQAVQVTSDQNSVSWIIADFAPGITYEYVMIAKANVTGIVENSEKCVTNIASVVYNGIVESSNTASVCIANTKGEVLGEKLPDTGIAETLLSGISLLMMAAGALGITVSEKKNNKSA